VRPADNVREGAAKAPGCPAGRVLMGGRGINCRKHERAQNGARGVRKEELAWAPAAGDVPLEVVGQALMSLFVPLLEFNPFANRLFLRNRCHVAINVKQGANWKLANC